PPDSSTLSLHDALPISQLAAIPHIRRLRIHSRLPVVLPERIDDAFVEWMSALPWPVAFVIHANHANEFDAPVDQALDRLRRAGRSEEHTSELQSRENLV